MTKKIYLYQKKFINKYLNILGSWGNWGRNLKLFFSVTSSRIPDFLLATVALVAHLNYLQMMFWNVGRFLT